MQSTFDMTAFLRAALAEDIGAGDITGNALIPAECQTSFAMNARQELVVCGLTFLQEFFALIDPAVKVEILVEEGTRVVPPPLRGERLGGGLEQSATSDSAPLPASPRGGGGLLARLSGPARALLAGERTALNLVQQLSGVATLTRQYVDAVAGTSTKIYDTRKTIPGLRQLQKYAVRCGGGENHRMGLYDAVLIKDNHIAVVGGVTKAVALARQASGGFHPAATVTPALRRGLSSLETDGSRCRPRANRDDTASSPTIIIECDTLPQVEEAIAARADIILLDNMNDAGLSEAVGRIRSHNQAQGTHILSEASGNVSLTTVRAIAETGVDRISVGKLTHSAVAVDIGLDEV